MNSILVALMVHLLDPAALAGNVPFYVVPAKPFGAGPADEPLPLTTSPVFGETELKKWQAALAVAGRMSVLAELCYRSAYQDLKQGVDGMADAEHEAFLVQNGGYHALARVAVKWCNVSVKKLSVLPLKHPDFARGERAVREAAYEDDIAFLRACRSEACVKEAPERFGREVVGVGLDAEK